MDLIRRTTARDFTWNRTGDSHPQVTETTAEILADVKKRGDSAVRAYTARYDGCKAAEEDRFTILVPESAMQSAWHSLPQNLQESLEAAAARIRTFHEAQAPTATEIIGGHGECMGQVWRPISRVGVYAPGGRSAYPSTVLMDVIPAQVAGVREIVLVSPPARDSELPHNLVLAAAYMLGIREVYRVGGAQAVAALTYGTESIRPVHKIVGPGNIYVATAKRLVMGSVGIDSIAGPSEVFIVADETANPKHVASDLLAQAEHDPEAGAVCVSTSKHLLDQVLVELQVQLETLPRREIAEAALREWGALVEASSTSEAFTILNQSAPEHVELLMEDALSWLDSVEQAGAVFLGHHTPEPVGDYYAGTNHVLPTHGSARYASGLGVHDFLRRMSYVMYTEQALAAHTEHITALAGAEQLDGHARSVTIRQEK